MRRRLSAETGQVLPLVTVALLTLLLGVCALVLDIGAWFTASRQVQSVVDAAALAAAQDLPGDPTAAVADANAYAQKNGGALSPAPVVSTTDTANDTITVTAAKQAPLFFARAFGITSATVHARAVAQVTGASQVPPGGIGPNHTGQPIPLVVNAGSVPPACGCAFGQQVTLVYGSSNQLAAGQFGLLDFSNGSSSTSPGTIASWILNGYPSPLGLGTYQGVNGNKTMPQAVDDAMAQISRNQPTILLPAYSSLGNGSYTIDGWAAFQIASWSKNGGNSILTGSFVRLQMPIQGPPGQDYGVGKVGLTG